MHVGDRALITCLWTRSWCFDLLPEDILSRDLWQHTVCYSPSISGLAFFFFFLVSTNFLGLIRSGKSLGGSQEEMSCWGKSKANNLYHLPLCGNQIDTLVSKVRVTTPHLHRHKTERLKSKKRTLENFLQIGPFWRIGLFWSTLFYSLANM